MTFEKTEVLLAKISHIDIKPSGKPFIYIKNKSGSKIDPCGTPEFIFHQSEVCPFSATLCFRSLR